MADRKYLIGSGWHESIHNLIRPAMWLANVRKYAPHEDIFIVADSGHVYPGGIADNLQVTRIRGNLGHAGDLLHGNKKYRFPGGVAMVMTIALYAYQNECDLIYHESDCLLFGDCVGRMYDEIGDGGIIFGKSSVMPCENCLFLLKHEFIPEFVATYAASPAEHTADQLAECKFARWAQQNPMWKYHSLRGGRDRPLPWEDSAWYLQKATQLELDEMARRGLV